MQCTTRLLVAAALLSAGAAHAQTQIRPRVLLMVDTSGSMSAHLTNDCTTGGDGSNGYKDAQANLPTYYKGLPGGTVLMGTNCIAACSGAFDGVNSRLFAAKGAVTNVLNASGDIDWGLMTYSGTFCAPSATPFTAHGCTRNNQCTSGTCTSGTCRCATDLDCAGGEVCNGGVCGTDSNLCNSTTVGGYFVSTCPPLQQPRLTWAGSCGTTGTAKMGACGTVQTCYQASDCTGGGCTPLVGSGAMACACNGNGQCPTNYACTGGRCIYQLGCQSDGGLILVDPSVASSASLISPYVNNFEDYTPKVTTQVPAVVDPELRGDGLTPLAATARTATAWYQAITDSKKDCRPYVLVQLTDGVDTCEGSATASAAGPVAAAEGFVASTVPNANKNVNKVYVIGLAFGGASNTVLDKVAAAGGTVAARYANSQQDIEAALADIVASSVLVEKCNNADDDCDGVCDEPFPDVPLSGACGTRAAKACDNGALAGTHCFAQGAFRCSLDHLSEECSASKCSGAPGDPLCPTAETCNGIDDDCNGIIDDCTPFVPGSCCTSMCPKCNPTGVPQPETCNGCDDDCDGIADNHLTDTGLGCGSNIGICTPGTTFCCAQVNPTTGTCMTDPVTQSMSHNNPDMLFCLGGQQPLTEVCNGVDDNCNGLTDEGAGMACFPFAPPAMAGAGICRAGSDSCMTSPIPVGGAGCPTGFPAGSGKPCPNPTPTFGACTGAMGPGIETCNGVDDDCDGVVDDNLTDPWLLPPNNSCCPTGNLADCMGGGACMLGAYQCVNGVKTCVGGVAKSPEICDGKDNDCNGLVDDVPGLGANCTGPPPAGGMIFTKGPCKAQFVCAKDPVSMMVVTGGGPNGLTCHQVVGPTKELCNGIDDDCNGVVDDNLMDPLVGVHGGTPCKALVTGMDKPPCDPGTTACVNGAVVCKGAVGPMPNQCNGISTDCTGMVNTNGNCPTGFQCSQGMCVLPCSGGEFPCPGGFVCQTSTMLCIPDQCQALNCQPPTMCQLDATTGKFACIDPCSKVTCTATQRCQDGVCYDNSCKMFPCPTGQLCVGSPPACQADPCAGITCPAGQFCQNGMCSGVCSPPCAQGSICSGGKCVASPCTTVHCDEGLICVVQNNQGTCVVNMCAGGCTAGQACCLGACQNDPCGLLTCPGSSTCKVDQATCTPSCQAPVGGPSDQVVGEGGGGFACSVAVGAGRAPPAGPALLLLLVALWLCSRRRGAQ